MKQDTTKDKRPTVLMQCIDILTGTTPETIKTGFTNAVDTLGDYPRPTEKGNTTEPPTPDLIGYLLVSNARNILKLGRLEYYTFLKAQYKAIENLSSALEIITNAKINQLKEKFNK